jgi:hypothetical protein
MFIIKNAYNAPIAHSVDGENSGAAKLVANGVQALEREFSLMEQEHARIRAEALAAHVNDVCEPRAVSATKRAPLESSTL